MKVIKADNVNGALNKGLIHLLVEGSEEDSRNGKVIVAPTPVTTVYQKPLERVLFSPVRDANPFFHLMESLWMLSGRNDLEFPQRFNSKFGVYSDDGKIINGAYGWRWREQFGYDQLEKIIDALTKNPSDRRQVLQMWDARADLGSPSKDVPCNTNAYFRVHEGQLDMTVCNRSNDVIWGAYGANAVHFSFLQEYMAHKIGVHVGRYYQMSNNYHVYTDIYSREALTNIANDAAYTNMYVTNPMMKIIPLMNGDFDTFDIKLDEFLETGRAAYGVRDFFDLVAEPMLKAFMVRKEGDKEEAYTHLNRMPNCDWRAAATQWILRRDRSER